MSTFDVLISLSNLLQEESDQNSPDHIYRRANKFEAEALEGGYSSKKKSVKDSVDEDDSKDEEVESDDEEVETPDESPSTINLADAMQFEKLIDVLNQFRASHSLTDKDVSVEMQKYFSKLTSEEKKVLHVFLKGLVQITLLDVDGKAAYSPSDLKFDISKSGSASSEKIKSIKRKQKSKEAAKDLSNSPIKIGESKQNKASILKLIRENE